MKAYRSGRRVLASLSIVPAALLWGAASATLGVCGPFTDVTSFCSEVLEIFYLGITTGTTPATYDPASNVSRLQMAIFLSRSADRLLQRGSRRAALKQFWTPQNDTALGLTPVGTAPNLVESDGADLWVANNDASVSRVRGSDGKLLETWTGATLALGVLPATGKVFVSGSTSPGNLYRIDPTQPAGAVTTVASNLGETPRGLAFDGSRIWAANGGFPGSVSIVTPGATIPWTVTTVTAGFLSLRGALYDGTNVWVTDYEGQTLLKLNGSGAILLTVTIGAGPQFPVFDGTNIWAANRDSNSVSVVRASNGAVLATLTGNGLNVPRAAAFDGQRILVANSFGPSVSLWKAADLTALGSLSTGASTFPIGACSDGVNFWVTLQLANKLARF